MKIIIYFSIIFILFYYSCKNKKSEKIEIEKSKDLISYLIKKDNNCIYKIFYKKIDSKYSRIDSIFLPKTNQTINLSIKELFFVTQIIESFAINSNFDYNFDGYNDIHISNNDFKNYEKVKNDFYFLFDKSKCKFIESKQLESIGVFDICFKNKCLHSKSFNYENEHTIYNPFDYSDYNYAKLIKYKWLNELLKPVETIEEKKLDNVTYSIKKTNFLDNSKQEFTSKKSIIEYIKCE